MSEQQAEQLMQQMQMLETYFSDLSQREGTFVSILNLMKKILKIFFLNLKFLF
jgi:Cdc6-like AAA superfamily ATPase